MLPLSSQKFWSPSSLLNVDLNMEAPSIRPPASLLLTAAVQAWEEERAAGCEPPVTATMDWERNQARGSNRKRKWRRGGTSEQLGNKGRAQRRREAWKRIGSTGTEILSFPSPGILASPFPFKLLHLPPLILSMAHPSPVGAVAQMQWRNRRGRTTQGQEDATIHAKGWARAQWQVELRSHVKAFNTCSEFWV